MKSYHLLTIRNFDESVSEYCSKQQYSLIEDAEPISSLKKSVENYYKDFNKYQLFHEAKKNGVGRAYGRGDSFDKYIDQKVFNVFLWKSKKILIFESNKSSVNSCIKRFKRDYGENNFNLIREPVDFSKVLRRAINITGGWFGEIDGNVNSVGIFGDHVDLSGDYDKYAAVGKLSSLTIEVDLGGDIYMFMITKDRSVVLFNNNDDIEKDLDLIVQIYNELL